MLAKLRYQFGCRELDFEERAKAFGILFLVLGRNNLKKSSSKVRKSSQKLLSFVVTVGLPVGQER